MNERYDVLDDFLCDLTCEEYYRDGWGDEEDDRRGSDDSRYSNFWY